MTNIYFAGSIRGGRNDAALYLKIVEQLKQYGTVFTEHVASPTVEQGLYSPLSENRTEAVRYGVYRTRCKPNSRTRFVSMPKFYVCFPDF